MGNSKGIQQALKESCQGLQEYFCCVCGMASVLVWGIEKQALDSGSYCTRVCVIVAKSPVLSEPQFLHLYSGDRNPYLTGLLEEVNHMT